jgi:S1-C subfamily serine protease
MAYVKAVATCVMILHMAGLHAVAQQSEKSRGTATLKIQTALVLPDLTVRPVPLHELELIDQADTLKRVSLRTDLSGVATVSTAPGDYMLRSLKPTVFTDSAYTWSMPVSLKGSASVELTNANAQVTQIKRIAARQVAPEHEIFERAKSGVFRVEAGLGHGSGFLIDAKNGLVVTNEHVVANATTASVYLDTLTRVPAQVVVRDRGADLAIVRIPTTGCGNCAELPLLSEADQQVITGERILAIGFPLNQEMTLTTGIVSSVRDGAIISDVNINHGNSGGPMLNLAGQVVGVNAFGDFTNQGGPGISGAIGIKKLRTLLAKVNPALAALPPLEDRKLPVMPRESYPVDILKEQGQILTLKDYKKVLERDAGRFTAAITTPVLFAVYQNEVAKEMASDRKKREAKAGVAADEQYSSVAQVRDWHQYVGAEAAPVVTVKIVPKIAETFGSMLGRAFTASMIGVAGKAKLKFQGDVRGARFFRNGEEIEPLRGGHGPQEYYVDNAWVQLKDVADMGYYVLPASAFAPDTAGVSPTITVLIDDLKNPKEYSVLDMRQDATARVWNDFVPYFKRTQPERSWSVADAKKKSPEISVQCNRLTHICEPGKPKSKLH